MLGVQQARPSPRSSGPIGGSRAGFIRTSIRVITTAAARFRQILEAYETLIDPDRRARYDAGHPIGSAGAQPGRADSRASISRRAACDYSATSAICSRRC